MKANQKLKEFKADDNAAIGMIITGALILILSIIIVPVFFRTAASTDAAAVDNDLRAAMGETTPYRPAANATNTIIDIGSSVMNLNPLAALVAVAGGIIGILLAVLSPKMFAGAGL